MCIRDRYIRKKRVQNDKKHLQQNFKSKNKHDASKDNEAAGNKTTEDTHEIEKWAVRAMELVSVQRKCNLKMGI